MYSLKEVGVGSPFTACIYSMIADTIEYGNWRTGIPFGRIALQRSDFGICKRLEAGLPLLWIGFVMDATGDDGLTAIQSQSAHVGIQFLFVGMPVIILGTDDRNLWLYRLDHEYPEIMRQLQRASIQKRHIGHEYGRKVFSMLDLCI